MAWNHENCGDRVAALDALYWSVTAMADLAPRLAETAARDRCRALAVISEAVWQVTIVDATLVRYYPEVYDGVLAALVPEERRLIEGTMAGLRFVRNRMQGQAGRDDFIGRGEGGQGEADLVAAWAWAPQPEPAMDSLRPGGRTWELARYHAYQNFLAYRNVDETLSRAGGFVSLTAGRMQAAASIGTPTGQ